MTTTVFFRGVAWLLVAAIVTITLSPLELRPNLELSERWERFVAFAVIAGVFCLGYPKHRIYIIVLVIGMIGLLEMAQKFVPGRHGRLLRDGMPKVLGTLCGAMIAILIERCIKLFKKVP